ncbi:MULTISPECIES: hypothetical protein [Roseovarius]|uniref:hypothetical protein n=1 Tax=Roseovarius TaxID=74030 RepID=UPI001FECB736|nr:MULTISPECIES: hypothetical protein [Roseovarius]
MAVDKIATVDEVRRDRHLAVGVDPAHAVVGKTHPGKPIREAAEIPHLATLEGGRGPDIAVGGDVMGFAIGRGGCAATIGHRFGG